MRSLIDGILHVDSLSGLIAWFLENEPEYLKTDGEGNVQTDPYVIVGFDRTPIIQNGDEALVYVRMTPDEASHWENEVPSVDILAQAPYTGMDTPDNVYSALFQDAEAKATYDAVYTREPYDVDDGEGGTTTVTPPERFGQLA